MGERVVLWSGTARLRSEVGSSIYIFHLEATIALVLKLYCATLSYKFKRLFYILCYFNIKINNIHKGKIILAIAQALRNKPQLFH